MVKEPGLAATQQIARLPITKDTTNTQVAAIQQALLHYQQRHLCLSICLHTRHLGTVNMQLAGRHSDHQQLCHANHLTNHINSHQLTIKVNVLLQVHASPLQHS